MTDLLTMLEAGETNVDRLSDPSALRAAAVALVAFAKDRGVTSLLAASPVAERLVGAALMATSEFYGIPTQRNAGGGTVLIVDINVASGTSIARAARRARHTGAVHVLAAVLHKLTTESTLSLNCDVDELAVLDVRE